MPNKATKNMMDLFKNPFKKTSPHEKLQEEREQVSKCRESERALSARLSQVQTLLNNPSPNAKKLSDEKIGELDLGNVIEYVKKELSYPLIVEQDLEKLDACIKFYIDALYSAVVDGLAETAQWSCTALITAIKSLRIPIDGIDEEYAAELYENRLQYANNMQNLVKTYREWEYNTISMAILSERRQKMREELDQKKAAYIKKRESGAIDAELAELKQKANNLGDLSDAAKAVQRELNDLHYGKGNIDSADAEILQLQTALTKQNAEIGTIRNQLATPPRATDPNLQARLNKANELYVNRLRRELNKTEEGLRAYEAYLVELAELAKSGAVIRMHTVAMEADNAIRLEGLNQMVMEAEAAGMRIRDIETQNLVRDTIEVQQTVEVPVEQTVIKKEVPVNTNKHTINIM